LTAEPLKHLQILLYDFSLLRVQIKQLVDCLVDLRLSLRYIGRLVALVLRGESNEKYSI
jgi:hypothetical protein